MEPAVRPAVIERYHEEVVAALRAIGDAAYGRAVQQDRGSRLQHLGIGFPDLRGRVKRGFSFYRLDPADVLGIWDGLWHRSPYGDVLFAALEYYAPRVRRDVDPALWPVLRRWVGRVDNWCHSDGLSAIYSRILERYPGDVLPTLAAWNASDDQWLRRVSLVSLIHYAGENAVFLPPSTVLPMVSTCIADDRHYVQTAVGWVLREEARSYPAEILRFLEAEAAMLGPKAFSRAIERLPQEERLRLRRVRASWAHGE
jgi:3-methyladenine DNA glycosylase AlkD